MGMLQTLGRLYMQFLILVFIALFFAYILNAIFAIADNEMRIMFSAIFLASFAVSIMAFNKM